MRMSDIVPWPLRAVSKNAGDDVIRLMIKAGIVRKINSKNLLFMPMGIMSMDRLADFIVGGYDKAYETVHDELDEKGLRSLFKLFNDELNGKRAAFYVKTGSYLEVYFQEGKFEDPYLPDFLSDIAKRVDDRPTYVAIHESGAKRYLLCQECARIYQPDTLEIKAETGAPQSVSDIMEVYTPGAVTIDKLCRSLDISPEMTVKTMIYEVERQGRKEYYAIMVRGDRTISSDKLKKYFNADRVGLADESIVGSVTGSPPGFCGPVGIKAPIFADMEISHMDELVAGANKMDTHFVGCTPGRDFQVEEYLDLRCGVEGDLCPHCGNVLKTVKCDVLIEDCKTMEGIHKWVYSTGELLKSIIENGMDETGIKWPKGLAPFDVAVELTSVSNENLCSIANDIIERLGGRFNILYDDRDIGFKARLYDMDLIGVPYTIIISGSTLEKGMCEIRKRDGITKEAEISQIDKILTEV